MIVFQMIYKNLVKESFKEIIIGFRIHKCIFISSIVPKTVTSAGMLVPKQEILPPATVRGLTKLDKNAFRKDVSVPFVEFDAKLVDVNKLKNVLNRYLLKMENLKPLQPVQKQNCDSRNEVAVVSSIMKRFLLNPYVISSYEDFPSVDQMKLLELNVPKESFGFTDIILTFDNWKAEVLLKFVLPLDKDPLTSYSIIGHIVHVNIRDHLLAYKQIIGEILLEKVKGIKTVVNKTDIINNKYRNFEMEILCGEKNLITQVKENHCSFELDFSSVYWNPRLCTEHDRIVSKLAPGDTLYDVFAGVGPFSIPASKRKCFVLANDLNPESFRWLVHNGKLNKVSSYLKAFNKDGRDFISEDVKSDMLEKWKSGIYPYNMHITMNLPALAVTFLKVFDGLFDTEEMALIQVFNAPVVHVYCFCKGDGDLKTAAIKLVEDNLGYSLTENLIEVFEIRNVSNNKEMFRVSFRLSKNVLFRTPCKN